MKRKRGMMTKVSEPVETTLFHSSRMECCGQLVTGRSGRAIVEAMEDHLRGAGAQRIACSGLPISE